MKSRAGHWIWLLALSAVLFGVTGCATNEPGNESVRPWNSPESWEGGTPMMNQQHQ